MITWTKQQAREFFVNYQMVNVKDHFTVHDVFKRIKTIQMDPLNVVGINPELVLQARVTTYKQGDLHKALYQERYLMDGWEKQMSIYETKYFEHFKYVREHRSFAGLSSAKKYLNLDATPFIDEVYDIVKKQGPILSSQIKLGQSTNHRWGHTKPSTVAIDYLWHKGVLSIYDRINTQKVYDLLENCHPTLSQKNHFLTEDDFIEWYLYRRIQTLGLAWSKSNVQFDGLHIKNKKTRDRFLDVLLHQELIEKVRVQGIKEDFFIPSSALKIEKKLKNTISFIAPLDPLTWDRNLLKQLFDFDYVWEVYTPVQKRKYGYYVLPILRGAKFIGRVEFYKQRKQNPLRVKSIQLQEGIKESTTLYTELNRALNRFAKYLHARTVITEQEGD